MKKIMTFFVIFFLIQSVIQPVKANRNPDSFSLSVRFYPEKIVSPGSTLTLRCSPREYGILSVFLLKPDHRVVLTEAWEISSTMENELEIPVTYPITSDFTLRISASTPDLRRQYTEDFDFQLQTRPKGPYRIRGRILQCSETIKKGLEGAIVETLSGPSYARTETEDDGYFSLEQLQTGQYRVKISHDCTANSTEKIIWVDQDTPFQEGCLAVYGLPDIDLWMNKPSGYSYEKGEMAEIKIRSSLRCSGDLVITDLHHKQWLCTNLSIPEEQLVQFYWKIPEHLCLGKYFLYFQPREAKLCGKAQYLFEIKNNIKTGAITGVVMVDGKPIEGAEVYLPLQFMEPVYTNAFGQYEIQDVKPGIHTVRARKNGFIQMDRYGVEVKNGLLTEDIHLSLLEEEPELLVNPDTLFLSTHEKKSVESEIEIKLAKGYCRDITTELIGAPPGITLSSQYLPSLLQEKRIIMLRVSETVEPGEYKFSLQVHQAKTSKTIEVNVVVSGLSIGTFDVIARPYKQSVSVGEEAVFELDCSKFTNFNKPIEFSPLHLPDYWGCTITPHSVVPPSTTQCILNPSQSVKPGFYTIMIQAKADHHIKMIPLPVEVLPVGGDLQIFPASGWQPIIEPGSQWEFPLSFSSAKGITENVRINVDFGPSWMKISNREIGSLSHQTRNSSLVFTPGSDVGVGGFDYAISFTYGSHNEGYQKLSGRIYVLLSDPLAPTNMRAKLIEEENKIQLTWGPPAKNALEVVGYNLYKSLHYPNVESSYPMNSSLLKDRILIDTDFKAGKTYWYVVKAVYSDGSISKKSNTAEITVTPFETVTVSLTLSKGENGTYYTGKPMPFSLLSSVDGSVSFSLTTPNLDIQLINTRIQAMQPAYFHPVTPMLSGSAILKATFISQKGSRKVITSALRIKDSNPGSETLPILFSNSLYDIPLSGACLETWEGPTSVQAFSDKSGRFSLKGLSKGSYRFVVTKDHYRLVTEEILIPSHSENPISIDGAWEENASFLFWNSLNQEASYETGASIPLCFKSKVDQDVSVRITNGIHTKTLITQLHLDANRTQLEYARLSEDLPPGDMIVQAINLYTKEIASVSITLQRKDPEGSIFWPVYDTFGNPVPGCLVNEIYTNDWGYFYLPEVPEILTCSKYGFETTEVVTANQDTDNITLPFLRKPVQVIEQTITIAKDYSDITLHFSEQEGLSFPFSIEVFLSKPEEEGSETALFRLDSLVLFAEYTVLFKYNPVEWNDLTDVSRMEIKTEDGSRTVIPLVKGNEEKLFLETDPDFLFISRDKLVSFDIDLYCQASFQKPVQLTIESDDPAIECRLSSQMAYPGSILSGSILLKQNKPTHTLQLNILMRQNEKLIGQAVLLFTLLEEQPTYLIENEWSFMTYPGIASTYSVFFSEVKDPVQVTVQNSLPISVESKRNTLYLVAKPTEIGLITGNIQISTSQNTVLTFPVQIHCIEKDPWFIPSLTALNQPEGILLQVRNLTEGSRYKINRVKQISGNPFLPSPWLQEADFLDQSVKPQTVYTYQIFASNGRLESDWSNPISRFRNPLSLTTNLQDGLIINKQKVEVKGSTNGTYLFINDRSIRLDSRGGFAETILCSLGDNVIRFVVKDDYGNELQESRKVTVDIYPPVLTLLQPSSLMLETILPQITIQLHADEACVLSMNQQTIQSDYLTDWKISPSLAPGKQSFQFFATDKAGNQSKLELTVIRYQTILTIELAIDRSYAIINGKSVPLDAPPVIVQGRTMVPIRFIGEAFGAKVDWDANTKKIRLTLDSTQIQLQIGQKTAYRNKQAVILDAPPLIIKGRTFVPLRFIGEAFGATVDWLAPTKEIRITFKK